MHGSVGSPQHIAIIMDGNGRWAKKRGLPRIEGHRQGSKSVENIVTTCREKGVKYLTLFSFSTENWNRPKDEIDGLMSLFKLYLSSQTKKLIKNGIRLRAVGDLEKFPKDVLAQLRKTEEKTKDFKQMTLILALGYGGREEITAAVKNIANEVKLGELAPEEINNDTIKSRMWSSDIPDPELLIRTSGEMRISNFLLWQLAYSEIVVTKVLWPEFNAEILENCIEEFDKRERRFGLTSEQISKERSGENSSDKNPDEGKLAYV